MKKEIKSNDTDTNKKSLFTCNKNLANNSNQTPVIPEKYYNKINPVKVLMEEKENPNRKYSDKTNNKEKVFNSKLKNFIKKNNSNSINPNNNNSRILRKESSLIRNKTNTLTRNQSKLTNISSKIQNNNEITDYGYLTTNTVEHIHFDTNSADFNTIEDLDGSYDNNFKRNLEKIFKTEANINQIDSRLLEDSNTHQIKIIADTNDVNQNNFRNKKESSSTWLDNSSNNKDKGGFFNRRRVEERKSFLGKNHKNHFSTQLKINVINLNDSCEERNVFLCKKDALINYKKFVENNYSSGQSNRKQNISASLNKNILSVNGKRNISGNKNKGNPINNFKHKTANKIKNEKENEMSQIMKKLPNVNLFTEKINKGETKKNSIIDDVNIVKLITNQNKILDLTNSTEKIKRKVSVCFNKSKNLKNSKPQNYKFIGSSLDSSNENSNLEADKNTVIKKNHVKIMDENDNLNDINDKKSTKSFKNISNKSVFYMNQSNKFLINLLNSSESSYADKFSSIANKFQAYVSRLISFISLNEITDGNISIFRNASSIILNAGYANAQINFTELYQKYCEDSKTDCSEINVNCLADNLEKNIKFQIDDILLGISPIVLDCNIIKQEFMESNWKSRKNLVFPKLNNEAIIEENIQQISNRSEQRCEKIKVIFKEMKENLSEVSDLLVNEFGVNLRKKLEDFRNENCEAIIKNLQKQNASKNSSKSNANNCSIGNRDNTVNNKSIKIRKTSKVIEIDLSNDEKKFDRIFNIISDNRKSLMEILQSEENSEIDPINYLKTDTNEKSISDFLKAENHKNKIIEADENSESSDKRKTQEVLLTEDFAASDIHRKKDEKRIGSGNLSHSQSRTSYKEKTIKNKKFFVNVKFNNIPKLKLKNIEIVKSKLAGKPKKVIECKLKSVSIINNNDKSKNKSINENKENNKKFINKKKLENIRIESKIELLSNDKVQETHNQKLQIEQAADRGKEENTNLISPDGKKELREERENSSIPQEKTDSKNFINNSNYINVNVNINPFQRRNTFEYQIVSSINNNLTFNNLISKSDNEISSFEAYNPKSRNASKKFNFESFPNANILYSKYSKLANQRKSQLEGKMNYGMKKRLSLSSNSMEEELDMMASIDEFDSGEKAHLDIPLSAINYANMPISGSKIIRRHSSFSKVLEKFNYKRFFNFRKSSYYSPSNIPNAKCNNILSNNRNSNNSIPNKNQKSSKNKDIDITNYEEKVTPEIKEFNLKKIEVFDSENNSEMNSSAPDLSISVSEVCNDVFHCCENMEINDKFSLIDFNKHPPKDRKKRSNPNRRKSRSVMNLMIVNLNTEI